MVDVVGFVEVVGSRFSNLELIGRGLFGDVYKGYELVVFALILFWFCCSFI